MSFLRHEEIYRSDPAAVATLGPEAASRWSAPEPRSKRAPGGSAASPIVPMSLRLAIPWQVALQQGLPPLHQPNPFCYEWERRSSKFQ